MPHHHAHEPAPISRRDALAWTIAATGSAVALPALAAQPRRGPRNPDAQQPATPQPTPNTNPPDQPLVLGDKPSPFVNRSRERHSTLVLDVNVRSYQEISARPDRLPTIDRWNFDSLTLVLPFVTSTANADVRTHAHADEDAPRIEGEMKMDNAVIAAEPRVLGDYQAGTRLAAYDAEADAHPVLRSGARSLNAELRVDMTCYRVEFDEARASRVDWPKGPWPAVPRSTLQPMPYVDFDPRLNEPYDPAIVQRLVDRWTEGRDPKRVRPVVLAKWIAGNLAELLQPSGRGLMGRAGALEGFDLNGAAATFLNEQGTEFDIPCALAAVYRAAGLPARVTLGYDLAAARGRRDALDRSRGISALSAWTEFALYDENTDSLAWIPVDIVGIRKNASRLPRNWMDRPLRGFADMPGGDGILPITHHFHPPTTVRAYDYPALWGWFVNPDPPRAAFQTINIRGETTPTRGR